jgi:hypothetical protein
LFANVLFALTVFISLDGKDPMEEEVYEQESINAKPKPKQSDG